MNFKFFAFMILLLTACQEANQIEKDLEWLLHADPVKDAKKAISVGDLRYVGTIGMFADVPWFAPECISEETVRLIQVSDLVESYEQNKLQAIAPVYATAYNYQILQYQKKHGLKQCDS
ncbi:hypothetical protein IC617_17415 [Neiella sp. HB171785]|uniref:Uncharacterized protein n=1 Tax=Neiella litorisoli TaxID=2771431 RepID=A0A8J6QKT4_9GAMM|nr:hypothetical protein [Neiella litorisoli]MBD1391208.1 hypothetical protein [Neiella litorisoli]